MVHTASPPRLRILTAARRLFFEQGFARVSTDHLSKAACVSKATLYKYFDGMNELLRAVVEAEVESFECGVPVEVATKEEFSSTLIRFGTNLLQFLNQPEIIRFSQLMFEEARLHPDLARDFYDCAFNRTQEDLARLLQQGIDLGFMKTKSTAAELAEQLLGLWEGFGFVRALLGLTDRPFHDPSSISHSGVVTLLHGHVHEVEIALIAHTAS